MNIYLAGMIAAGKTTIGRPLAARLGWTFADLDDAMALQAGKPFHQVVAEEGWLGFRVREYAIIKQFAAMEHAVIGLGGGTVRYEWNCDAMRGTGVRVLLTADLETLASRLKDNDRPRVNPGTTMQQDIARIWGEHQDLYYRFADLVYPTDQGKSVEAEVDELIEILQRDFHLA